MIYPLLQRGKLAVPPIWPPISRRRGRAGGGGGGRARDLVDGRRGADARTHARTHTHTHTRNSGSMVRFPTVAHQLGTSTFVFVSFEQIPYRTVPHHRSSLQSSYLVCTEKGGTHALRAFYMLQCTDMICQDVLTMPCSPSKSVPV